MSIDLNALKEPFAPEDIEWRIGQAGEKSGSVWAKCLAYVTSRAIMERLDAVCGPENWQTAFRIEGGALAGGIGIRVGDEWVWKWDGVGHLETTPGLSESDARKGDFSNAMKRAGYQWGMGRYLYKLPEGWANVHPNGQHFARLPKDKGNKPFKWDPPALPGWALPEGAQNGAGKASPAPQARQAPDPAPKRASEAAPCPVCAGDTWDNAERKASGDMKPNAPDFKCKDRGCDGAWWPGEWGAHQKRLATIRAAYGAIPTEHTAEIDGATIRLKTYIKEQGDALRWSKELAKQVEAAADAATSQGAMPV